MNSPRQDLQDALYNYGEAMVAYAIEASDDNYKDMCLWQEQAFYLARIIAKETT